eukprot:890240-Rhodomonas_salina.4
MPPRSFSCLPISVNHSFFRRSCTSILGPPHPFFFFLVSTARRSSSAHSTREPTVVAQPVPGRGSSSTGQHEGSTTQRRLHQERYELRIQVVWSYLALSSLGP